MTGIGTIPKKERYQNRKNKIYFFHDYIVFYKSKMIFPDKQKFNLL